MSKIRSEEGSAALPHKTEGALNAGQNESGSIGVSIHIADEKLGGHIRRKCVVLKVHDGGCAHGYLNVGDEIVAIDPTGGTNPVLIAFDIAPGVTFDREKEIDKIARLILGPPGTKVTLDIIRRPSGRSFEKRHLWFTLYRQILHLSSSDAIVAPAITDASVPSAEPGTLPSSPSTTSQQPQPHTSSEPVHHGLTSDSDVFKGLSISAIDSAIYGVFQQLNFEKATIKKIESLLIVNPKAAMESITEEKRKRNLDSKSAVSTAQEFPDASSKGGNAVAAAAAAAAAAAEEEEEEVRVVSRIYSNGQLGVSAIDSFLKQDSYGGHLELTIYGKDFNNKPTQRKDMWVRLVTYDPHNPRILHEWISGSKRYLKKEHQRTDSHFCFNKPTATPNVWEPFVFDLAAMLQGQRSKYKTMMVRIVVMKQQRQSQTASFCEISQANELGIYECKLADLIENTKSDVWHALQRNDTTVSQKVSHFLHECPGWISLSQKHWATTAHSQPRADGICQAEEPPVNPEKCFKHLEKLFAAKQRLLDNGPKSSERYLGEAVEILKEILDPSVFDDLVTLHRDDTRNVIDHLASKMRILTEAIQSEGWHDHENYRAVVKNVPQMLKSLTEQSLHHSPKDILKSQFLKIRDRLKVIEAAMYPMNLSLLVDLMPKASTSHQDMRGKKVSLLIGSSQAGKSTILNFLAGANLKKVCPDGILRFRLKNIPESLPQETKQALQHVAIGSGYRSETIHVRLIPVRHNGSFLYLCDAPGFGDDRGPEIDISNGIGVISALKKCLKVKIILVVSGDEKGTKNEGLERVFTKVSDLISINPNESRQKLIYLLNNAEDITNFHDWICGVYKNKPPQDTAIKRIFEDAMCKSCCEECSILRAARSDPHQGPVPAYDSVHLSIARVLATRSAATSNSDELSPIESQEHPNFRQIFAKQVQCKLTQEELSKTALGSKFRSHFLDYVARDDMEIDPNSLRFICSEESIEKLHACLDQVFLQLKHFCSKEHFRPDIIEFKMRQLAVLDETGLFRECPSSKNVNILQDFQNIRSFVINMVEALSEEFLSFIRQPLSATFTLDPLRNFWRLVQLLSTHSIFAKSDKFDTGSSEPTSVGLLPLSEFFDRWILFQDSLAVKCFDALANSMDGKVQSANPSQSLKVLVQTMCAVTDLCAHSGVNFQYLSPELLQLGESTSCILKEKYKQTLSKLIGVYEDLCTRTSSAFSGCLPDIRFFNQESSANCITYFKDLIRIRNIANILSTIRPRKNEPTDCDLSIDELCPSFTVAFIESKKEGANRALFDVLSLIPVSSLMQSVHEKLSEPIHVDEILNCLQISVLTPVSILHSVLSHESASAWDFLPKATVLLTQFVLSVQEYFCKMLDRRRLSLKSSMSAASISQIKAEIFHSLGIPAICQRLLHHNTEVHDNDKVPINCDIHLSLFHSSHVNIPEISAELSPKASSGNACIQQVFLPDLLFPIYDHFKHDAGPEKCCGLTNLFNFWFVVLKMTENCFECLDDANFSTFATKFQQTTIANCHKFLKLLRNHASDFIDNIDNQHDVPCEDSDWDCFRQYMMHLSNFADCFSGTSLFGKKLFTKECQYFSDIFKKCAIQAISLSKSLAESSAQLVQIDFNNESFISTMKQKCDCMFVAGDELLLLLRTVDKIQAGCSDEFRNQQFKDNIALFMESMCRFINSLPFLHRESAVVAWAKLDFLMCLQSNCLHTSREVTLFCLETGCLDDARHQESKTDISTLTNHVKLAVETSLGNWNEFLSKCSSTLDKHSQSIGELIRYFEECQVSDVQFSEKWIASQSVVSCVVESLFKHQIEINDLSPLYENLNKFTELQLHPLISSKFVHSSDVVVSLLLDRSLSLMRQMDTLFLRLRSFCSEAAVGVEGQARYQRLSDLLQFCEGCAEVDQVWGKAGKMEAKRGQSQSFASHIQWVQSELAKQRVSMDLQHSNFIDTLNVDGLLKVWPEIGKDAKQLMLKNIHQKLKSSVAILKNKLVALLHVSTEDSNRSQALQPNTSGHVFQDVDSDLIIFAVASWIPAFFEEDAQAQKILFKELHDVYDVYHSRPTKSEFDACVHALERFEFQSAEKCFGVIRDFHAEVDKHLKKLKSITPLHSMLQTTESRIEAVVKRTSDDIQKLREGFGRATQQVLKIFSCKSAVIKNPENIDEKMKEFDNLLIHLPVVAGIGIDLIESHSKTLGHVVEVANVFYGSTAWLAGIRKRDVLLHVDTLPCSNSKTPIETIRQRFFGPVGSVVDVSILRNNIQNMSFSVKRVIFDCNSAPVATPAALRFYKASSSQKDLIILLQGEKYEKMLPSPWLENSPVEIQAGQFCSLNFNQLRHKSYGFLRVLQKLDVSPQYLNTGTSYDHIVKELKSHVDKQLSLFVDLLSSECLTPAEAEKWQELNSDIFSEEFLQHLPENITKDKMQNLKIKASSENQLTISCPKLSSSIASDISSLRGHHPIGTPSVKQLLKDIDEKICSHCHEISCREDFLESFFDPQLREDVVGWNVFWHFLQCVYPFQTVSEHKSWQAWENLKNLFKKSVFARIPCSKNRSSENQVLSDILEPRCCFAFSEAAFAQLDFSKSQDVVSAVKTSFCFLQQKPFWNHALLTDFFNDFDFHRVLHRVCATLDHFFKNQKLQFDNWLNALSRHDDNWKNSKVDYAWMTSYYKIYMEYSSISDFLKRVSDEGSMSWIGDSNGSLLPDFEPLDVLLNPPASVNKFPFSVETFEEFDRRIRCMFQEFLDFVQSKFWSSDDSRSPSTLNNDRLYKKLNDNHQVCRVFATVFADTKWISKLSDNAYADAFAYFDGERSHIFGNPGGILYEADIQAQFARQIESYARLMILHNNLRSWHKHFEESFVKDQVKDKISRLNADIKSLMMSVWQDIRTQAVDSSFPQEFQRNLHSVCGLFRFLRCMASSLPLEIDGVSIATSIDRHFKSILASPSGSVRMKKISTFLMNEKEKVDDPHIVRFCSELIDKHKAFENVQIVEYNNSTRGFTIDTILQQISILEEFETKPGPFTSSQTDNVMQHYCHYDQLCRQRIIAAYDSIQRPQSSRDCWKPLLKSALMERCEMKNLSPNHKILEVLAASSVYWTMDIYTSGPVDDGDDYEPPWDQLKTPHAAQIVAVLRLLGLDKVPLPEYKDDGFGQKLSKVVDFCIGKEFSPLKAAHEFLLQNMDPHMVEVLTGQGKSVVLALTSIVLAFFNFRVDCACYSEYLSARDRIEFKNVFEFFNVADFIVYSTFNTLCERTINELVQVRGAVEQLVNPGQVMSSSFSAASPTTEFRKKVALIDEVDVFFSKSFYGQEYIPVARVRHSCISALIRQVFELSKRKLRLNEFTTSDIEEHLGPSYNQCKAVFKGWEFLVEHAVVCMMCDAMQYEDFSKNPYQRVESTRMLGYKEGDQISYTQTRRYMTVFSWLKEHSLDPKSVDETCMEQHMCLLVDCGHFGYEKLVHIGDEPHEYVCILGVTGTLKAIMNEVEGKITEQRKILDKFCRREANPNRPLKTLQCTFIPTVYAQAKGSLIFTERSRKSIWLVKHFEEFYQTIFTEIENCIKESRVSRAVLVVFETSQELQQCADNKWLEPYKGIIQKLTPEISDEILKKNIIEQASFPGKVTFITREFGRGTDFKGTNKEMNDCGGVHVIQTFLSEDFTEETQIQGRTARQGQNGSYCLVLLSKSLEKYFDSFKYHGLHPPESYKDSAYQYFVGSDDAKGYLQDIHVRDAYLILHAARQNFFTKDFQKSIRSEESSDRYHKAAMAFRVDLEKAVNGPEIGRASSVGQVREFLRLMNGSELPKPIERPVRRTMVLLDATGSMGSTIKGCKRTIEDVCKRAYKILKDAKVEAAFELQFTTYRNYDCVPSDLLCCSKWAKKPEELQYFLQNVQASGGTHWEEAVEVALQYANLEHVRNPIAQAILIGDAAPNTQAQVNDGRAGKSRSCSLPSNYWHKTPMAEPTFWETECAKLRVNKIPVHAFYVHPSAAASFEQISQKAGEGGVCQYLNMGDPQATTLLCNLLTDRILESLGQNEEEKKLFKDLYLKNYSDAKIMH